jgi:DNA replication protein
LYVNEDQMIKWFSEGSIAIPNLLMTRYAKLQLNEAELMLLLHVHSFLSAGNTFPTPDELSSRMSISTTECTHVLRKLMQTNFLTIKEKRGEDGVLNEEYSLLPLWQKLLLLLEKETKKEDSKAKKTLEMNLYVMFEKEFGRPLSPMESETLSMWLDEDGHDPVLIKTALRESVISGKLNFRYIDRILFEWKKNGIKNVEQATQFGMQFRKRTAGQARSLNKEQKDSTVSIPFYNWLDS